MGLGLSTNLNARDVPHPYRLKDERPDLFDFVEYSAPLELNETRRQGSLFEELWKRRDEVPALFHPVHLNLYGPELESAASLRALDDHLEQVGSPWVSNDVAWWHMGGRQFPGYLYLPPPLDPGALEDCAAHAAHVQSSLSVPLLLENPFVLAPRGDMHVLDFMAELHRRTGCGLLLDLGHLLSHQWSRGLSLTDGLSGFPLDKVVQIHIAGGVGTRHGTSRIFMDDHSQPVREELFELLEEVLPRCRSLRAVTFEGDGHPIPIAMLTLARLRERISRQGPSVGVEVPARVAREPRLPNAGRAWRVFEESYVEPVTTASERAERDIRLAVLAEQLDVYWPCTRLLLAGTREALERFASSKEFRVHLETGSLSFADSFATYARRWLREIPDERVAMVLAFETWMQAAAQRQGSREPLPGELALADGIAVASFPADLSELVYGARALKRHLTQRAWATGEVEHSALEALFQIARRVRQQPWTVALRRKHQGVDLILLEPRLGHLLQAVAAGVGEDELRKRAEEYPPAGILQAQALRLLIRKPRVASSVV